jgi:hypothetical protein
VGYIGGDDRPDPERGFVFPASSVLQSILRPGPSEPEVEFGDFLTKVRIRPAPADEESGSVVGMRMATRAGTRVVLRMLAPIATADLAGRIAWAVVWAKGA